MNEALIERLRRADDAIDGMTPIRAVAHLVRLCEEAAIALGAAADAIDEGAYDFPKYGLHTQRKALCDLIAFLYAEVGPRDELERLFDELRFPEDKLLRRGSDTDNAGQERE